VSDLWKVPTLEGDSISGPFTTEELANAVNHLEPGHLRDWIIFPEFTPDQLSIPSYAISSLAASANPKFPGSGEGAPVVATYDP